MKFEITAGLPAVAREEVNVMLKKFINDENGQGMVEYALIVALIAVVVIAVTKVFGKQIKGLFSDSQDKIQQETGVAPAAE